MYRRLLLFLVPALLGVTGLLGRPAARAQGNDPSVRLGAQVATVEADDRRLVAVTTIRQSFRNSGWATREGTCLLPIPDTAAILRFQVLDPPPKRGEAPEARGLLEPAGANLYRARVHRIPGRGEAEFEVVYAQTLTRRGTRGKVIYPILPAEGASAVAALSVRVLVSTQGAPQRVTCSTHTAALSRPSTSTTAVTYQSDEPPDGRDLVVDYEAPPSRNAARARLSVLTPADGKEDPYFLLALPPPAVLLRDSSAPGTPADIVFCLDISGSAAGRELNAIQEAAHEGLTDLNPGDRFGVIAFDDDARPFRRSLVPASPEAVRRALRFVHRLRKGGGSDPERALRAALEILGGRRAAGRTAAIAVLVDHEDPAGLGEAAARLGLARQGIRLVPLGAMADSRLVSYRLSGGELRDGPAVTLSRGVLTHGPALTAARFDGGSLNASYLYPAPERLPDLPLSTPVVLLGRLNQAPPPGGRVTLTGRIGGEEETLTAEDAWEPLPPSSPVPQLWANRRVARLRQLAGREREDSEELLAAVEEVRAAHGLAAVPAE